MKPLLLSLTLLVNVALAATPVSDTPEPSTLLLVALGIGGVIVAARRRK